MERKHANQDYLSARRFADGLLKASETMLSRLETSPLKETLSPADCFDLWANLGTLMFHPWHDGLSEEEMKDLDRVSNAMQARLTALVGGSTAGRLFASLEAGVRFVVRKICTQIDSYSRGLKSWSARYYFHGYRI